MDAPPLPAILADALATLQSPFLVLDGELRVRAASPVFFLEFGVSSDEALDRPVYELAEGRWSIAPLRDLLERIAPASEMVEGHPVPLPAARGGERTWNVNVRPVRTGANRIELLLLSFAPAADRAEAGSAGGELQRLAVEHVTDVVALYRPDGRCLFVGSACEVTLGYPRSEWLRHRACDLVHPADREALRGQLPPRGGTAGVTQAVVRVRRAGGEYLWMEIALRPAFHPAEGGLVHATARDITQRKRAEDALRWLSRQTKLILDSAGEGIFGVNTHGAVTFLNPAAAHLLGAPAAELMGRPYTGFAPGDGEAEDEIRATLRDGTTRVVTRGQFVRQDGRRIPVEFTCTPARQAGEVVGAVVTFRDISDRLRSELALRRAEWLAGVGQTMLALRHEINNPLTALLAEVSLLEMGGNTPEEEREMVASVAAQARRIRDVVRALTEAPPAPPVPPDPAP